MSPRPEKKVLLAMSGGVDSSVAAALLLRQGYEVVGCFMRLGSPDEPEGPVAEVDAESPGRGRGACQRPVGDVQDHPALKGTASIGIALTGATSHGTASNREHHHQGCCSLNDAADARQVAGQLGIPFYVLNFRRDFGRIMDYFTAEYHAGRTPNPCVRCNDWLKFGKLHSYARSLGADYVATGHYARIFPADDPTITSGGRLARGVDLSKDQSYVLFGTPRERLAEMLLPLGGMPKVQVRRLAQEFGLPVFDKPDSQEICFVPDQDYAAFIARREPGSLHPGDVVDTSGKVVGRHEGQEHFTIGQRRGVGVALGYPIYVVDKDPQTQTVTVGPREALFSTGLLADQTNWLVDPPAAGTWRDCQVKIRYNSPPVAAQVSMTGSAPGTLEVRFVEPQFAVTPGQAVVCYDGDIVLGGGWITQARRSL